MNQWRIPLIFHWKWIHTKKHTHKQIQMQIDVRNEANNSIIKSYFETWSHRKCTSTKWTIPDMNQPLSLFSSSLCMAWAFKAHYFVWCWCCWMLQFVQHRFEYDKMINGRIATHQTCWIYPWADTRWYWCEKCITTEVDALSLTKIETISLLFRIRSYSEWAEVCMC